MRVRRVMAGLAAASVLALGGALLTAPAAAAGDIGVECSRQDNCPK